MACEILRPDSLLYRPEKYMEFGNWQIIFPLLYISRQQSVNLKSQILSEQQERVLARGVNDIQH